MRIINSHVHALEPKCLEKIDIRELTKNISSLKDFEKSLHLIDPDEIIKQMDETEIEQSVLYALDAPFLTASNEYVYSLCEKYKGRFIGFASVKPDSHADWDRYHTANILEKAVDEFGFKGIKFHPPLQNFYPNDFELMAPIYKMAQKKGLPIVFHTGSTPFGKFCRLDQANPMLLDEVAVKYPDLKIIITHLGTMWNNEAFMVVEKNPNVYIDTAAYIYEIDELLTPNLIDRIGADKIIFGTDYPMPDVDGTIHRMEDFVKAVKGRLSDGVPWWWMKDNRRVDEKIFAKNLESILPK